MCGSGANGEGHETPTDSAKANGGKREAWLTGGGDRKRRASFIILRLSSHTYTIMYPVFVSPPPPSDTVNVVASDHRPFTTKQKAMGKEDFTKIPHGVSGVQDRMAVLWERGVVCDGGRLPTSRLLQA